MRAKVLLALIAAVLAGAGCYNTVNDHSRMGVPFVKDKIEARYERPVDQVFQAAKDVVLTDGALVNEGTIYSDTNSVKTVQGKVNQRDVWIRIEAIPPNVTAVAVQARTKAGGADVDLAAQIDKEIALKLATK